jgi:hypothetical protein
MESWRDTGRILGPVTTRAEGDTDMDVHASGSAADVAGVGVRMRYLLLSLGASLLLAVLTLAYVAAVGTPGELARLASYAPFLLPAAIAGVAPPSYVALDMLGRRSWLPAAAASAVALLFAFVVFWSAAIAVTPRPLEVRMDPATVIVTRPFTRADWLRYPDLRDRMVDDLLRSGRLSGMRPDEVSELLGKPARILGPGCREMSYEIGRRAGDSPLVLAVRFGTSGTVDSVQFSD